MELNQSRSRLVITSIIIKEEAIQLQILKVFTRETLSKSTIGL